MRQQNWMKSFRSQSRLDFTISQKVSSAGNRKGKGPVKIQLFSICQALMVHQAGHSVSRMSHFNAKFREAQVALCYGTSAELQ